MNIENRPFIEQIRGTVNVRFDYCTYFTYDVFALSNSLFCRILTEGSAAGDDRVRVLFVIDASVEHAWSVRHAVQDYFQTYAEIELAGPVIVLPGGETIKNDYTIVTKLQKAVNDCRLDRHSYIAAVGGGALLDVVGFAAATSHRGIRLLRFPTTVLSQDDSGVGVKNGVNAFGKKNFIGTFSPPWAVINDYRFLETLSARDWRDGIAEAIKVALIKDKSFFEFLEKNADKLRARDRTVMTFLLKRCAELHILHICQGGDAFEMGSSRPLDFGHWSAHKLEQLTNFEMRHGEAVSIGIAIDSTYSYLSGFLEQSAWIRILNLLVEIGFQIAIPEKFRPNSCLAESEAIMEGLQEFKEHLGGILTIQMLSKIGTGFNVHEINEHRMRESMLLLAETIDASEFGNGAPTLQPEWTNRSLVAGIKAP